MSRPIIRYDLHDMPSAYFADNPKANALRNQLIKNQVRISECEQGYLETTFFSDENIELINKQLILRVWEKSNKTIKIGHQTTEDLIIVMRYVFIEYARHLPYDVQGQIRELNCKVVSELLATVFSNANQKIDYLKDIYTPRDLVQLPQNTSRVRTLQSVSDVLFQQ